MFFLNIYKMTTELCAFFINYSYAGKVIER